MNVVPYSDAERKIIGEHISTTSFGALRFPSPMYDTPVTPKENLALCVRRETPYWFPTMADFCNLESRTNLDHVARAEVMDMGEPYQDEDKGGKDLFGVEWVYVPTVGGSMVQPGHPILEDVNDWPEVIKFPDIDALDWEECRRLNSVLNSSKRSLHVTFQNGIFERLISFMDFENAALALIDDDQKEAVHALFARLCEMYENMIDRYLDILELDGVVFHDDWGSQRAPFFSLDVCMEMVAPYLKRIADYCHSKGLWFQQHCCGKNELLVPAMIYAGVDMWYPQAMNDVEMLHEKYGDKIMFSMAPPTLPREASDAEIDAAAKAFVEQYAPTFAEKPFIVGSYFADPRYTSAIYKYSRKALHG